MAKTSWLAVLCCCLAPVGCGEQVVEIVELDDGEGDSDSDSDSDGDTDGDADTDTFPDDRLDAIVTVPPGFDDATVKLAVDFFQNLPPDPPPDVPGLWIWNPVIGPGQPFHLDISQPPQLSGEYYVVITLFVEGGGTDIPKPGFDWVGSSLQAHVFGPGTGLVQAGQIDLQKLL